MANPFQTSREQTEAGIQAVVLASKQSSGTADAIQAQAQAEADAARGADPAPETPSKGARITLSSKLSEAEIEAKVAALVAGGCPKEFAPRIVASEAGSNSGLWARVSEKGALSVYGMGRFPVTLYAAQWERLLAVGAQILAAIEANAETLERK